MLISLIFKVFEEAGLEASKLAEMKAECTNAFVPDEKRGMVTMC